MILWLCWGFQVSVGHKYLSLGRPEGKPISFYLNKKAVYTFLHLVGRINLGAFYSKSSKTFGENIFKNIRWEKVNSKNFLRDGVLLIPSKDVFQLLIKPSLELKATIKPSMFWLKLYEYQSWRGKGSIVNMNQFVCKCQLVRCKRFFCDADVKDVFKSWQRLWWIWIKYQKSKASLWAMYLVHPCPQSFAKKALKGCSSNIYFKRQTRVHIIRLQP